MDNAGVLRYFGGKIHKALLAADNNISEIRLRAGRPLGITIRSEYFFLCENGSLTDCAAAGMKVDGDDVQKCFEALCRYSVHSFQNQINSGFITVPGGHRAGICGSAVYSSDGKIENIRNISSINFRIASEVKGAADRIMKEVMKNGPESILVCGAPCSGKTTILRDICRRVGNKYPVSLIDERGEIAAVSGGNSFNDAGANTDILNGFSKPDGIITAVRALAPRMIVCDEIGSDKDVQALITAAASGIKAAATIHCSSMKELMKQERASMLIETGLFEYIVMMEARQITGIYRCCDLTEKHERMCHF